MGNHLTRNLPSAGLNRFRFYGSVSRHLSQLAPRGAAVVNALCTSVQAQ